MNQTPKKNILVNNKMSKLIKQRGELLNLLSKMHTSGRNKTITKFKKEKLIDLALTSQSKKHLQSAIEQLSHGKINKHISISHPRIQKIRNLKKLNEEEKQLLNMDIFEEEEKTKNVMITKSKFYIPKTINSDINKIIIFVKEKVKQYIEKIKDKIPFKLTIGINTRFNKYDIERLIEHNIMIRPFNLKKITTFKDFNIEIIEKYTDAIEKIEMNGSGWSFKKAFYCEVITYEMKQLRGKSYIPTPDKLKNPKIGLINIQNEDNECFKWCIIFHQSKNIIHGERVSKLKKIINKYNMDNIIYPCGFDEMEIFEKNNENTAINIFSYDEETDNIKIKRKSNTKGHDIINLLIIEKEEKEHYIYIKNIGSLLKNNKAVHDKITCKKCFRPFTEKQMENHINCENENIDQFETIIEFPEVGQYLEFTDYKKMIKKPFIVYADFESTLKPINNELLHKHIVNSYGLKVVCSFDEKYNKDVEIYRGENAVSKFIERIYEIKNETNYIIEKRRNKYKYPILTQEEEQLFKLSNKCYLCNCIFDDNTGKNRDHCHLTGKYRGSLCSKCN
jgi:hypothetical protein